MFIFSVVESNEPMLTRTYIHPLQSRSSPSLRDQLHRSPHASVQVPRIFSSSSGLLYSLFGLLAARTACGEYYDGIEQSKSVVVLSATPLRRRVTHVCVSPSNIGDQLC